REIHLGSERGQVRAGDVAVLVLDQMQMLDQQVALTRAVAEQRCDLSGRAGVDLPALGRAASLTAAWFRAIAAETRRILNVHCYLRSGEIERFQAAVQSRPPDWVIGNLYQK